MRLYTYNAGMGGAWHPGLGAFTPGFGDANTQLANQLVGSTSMGAGVANSTGSAIAGAVAGGASAASAILSTTALTGSAICPPCGIALAIGASLVGIITKMAAGCGNSCIEASDAANQAEPLLVQNVSNYTSAPVRYKSLQAAALANFDQIFTALEQKCQQIGGAGGTNCIKDRQAGACKWKATPPTWTKNADGSYSYTPAGPAGSGSSCWNWVAGYRDPIANDPGVVPDPPAQSAPGDVLTSLSTSLSSLLGGSAASGSISPLLLLLLGGAVLYMVTE